MSATAHSGRAGGAAIDLDGEPALAIAVIGLSAGGIRPLRTIIKALPRDLTCALVIAHHVAAPSVLPELIAAWTDHECRFASAGEMLRNGVIYVCPAQQHVVIHPDGTLRVLQRGRVRFVRPSVDWLFESAAASFG